MFYKTEKMDPLLHCGREYTTVQIVWKVVLQPLFQIVKYVYSLTLHFYF